MIYSFSNPLKLVPHLKVEFVFVSFKFVSNKFYQTFFCPSFLIYILAFVVNVRELSRVKGSVAMPSLHLL